MLKAAASASGKPCILLVDDQPANLLSYEVMLEEFDAQLLRATSGNEALQILLRHDVALVVLDVQMPGMDGFEVAELMQKARHSQNIPIIFVTAINQDPRNMLRGYQAGAADFLFKPVEPVVLMSKVQIFLELFVKSRELEASNKALQASLRELERLKEHNELLLFSVGDGIVSLDADGRVQFANPAAMALLDEGDSLIGSLLASHLAADDAGQAVALMLDRCREGERWYFTCEARRQGHTFPAEFTATAIQPEGGQFEGVSIIVKDVTDRHALEQKLKAESERDPLTGLVNRRGLERALRLRLQGGARGLALLYIDLDRFKPVNDRYGHQAGDSVLKFIAQRMISCTRAEDVVARIGGDEFCILVEARETRAVAEKIGNKLVELAAQPLRLGQERVQIGASVGIVLGQESYTLADMMHYADVAMYTAKGRGRGTVCLYEPGQEGKRNTALGVSPGQQNGLQSDAASAVGQPGE